VKEFKRIMYTTSERAVSSCTWSKFNQFADDLAASLPPSAEMTLCKRSLQEALHWWECAHIESVKSNLDKPQ
jgi:hypothetical protein